MSTNKTVNEVTLIGYVGIVPKTNLRRLEKKNEEDKDKHVTSFSLATHSPKRVGNELSLIPVWHRIVMWDKLAVNAAEYLQKGSYVFIKGELIYRQYEDGNGQQNTSTEIIAYSFKVLDRKNIEDYPVDEFTTPDFTEINPETVSSPSSNYPSY